MLHYPIFGFICSVSVIDLTDSVTKCDGVFDEKVLPTFILKFKLSYYIEGP